MCSNFLKYIVLSLQRRKTRALLDINSKSMTKALASIFQEADVWGVALDDEKPITLASVLFWIEVLSLKTSKWLKQSFSN